MSSVEHPDPGELRRMAERHVWGQFTTMGTDDDSSRMIERGEGCYVWDADGKRYLDGLAGLFVSQVGHGRTSIADAMARQAGQLAYFPLWTYTHPTAVELSARVAALAPGDLNRVFFTTGGSEAVESAWKLARQYFKRHRRAPAPQGHQLATSPTTAPPSERSRSLGWRPSRARSSPSCRGRPRRPTPTATAATSAPTPMPARSAAPPTSSRSSCARAPSRSPRSTSSRCRTPAAASRRPRGYFQEVREICDRYGILMISDEVICAWGRLGAWFGAERYGYQPDMITVAKGLTSGYAPLGGVIISDKVAEPFVGTGETFLHGITFAGHPVSCAAALANLDIMEKEDLPGRVREHEGEFRTALETLGDLPIVGEVRGAGYFYGIELVKDQATRETFTAEESGHLLRSFLSNRLLDLGLICRADDRGEPVIQLSPPLIAGPEQFDEIVAILRQSLTEAMAEMGG